MTSHGALGEGASLIFNLGGWCVGSTPLDKMPAFTRSENPTKKGREGGQPKYIYLEPKWPLFWSEKALFGGLTFKNWGHWGSRYISVAISWYFTTSYEIKGTLKQLYYPVVLEYFGRTFMYIIYIYMFYHYISIPIVYIFIYRYA